MSLIKMMIGFILGALGGSAAVFLLGCYLVDDTNFLFVLFSLSIGALLSGVIGSLCAMRIRWARSTFVRLGYFGLIGSLLGMALWVLVPSRSTDPTMLAIWFTPDRMLRQAPFGLVFGGPIGVAVCQIIIAVRGESPPPTVIHIGATTAKTEDNIWPPAPALPREGR